MKRKKYFIMIGFAFVAAILLFPRYGYTYIDPGTGSYVLQLLLAGFVSLVFFTKLFWRKIKSFFAGLLKKNKTPLDEPK